MKSLNDICKNFKKHLDSKMDLELFDLDDTVCIGNNLVASNYRIVCWLENDTIGVIDKRFTSENVIEDIFGLSNVMMIQDKFEMTKFQITDKQEALEFKMLIS